MQDSETIAKQIVERARKLVECFHSIYNDYIVFTEEARELLPPGIKYVTRGPLVLVPARELDVESLPYGKELKKKIEEYKQKLKEEASKRKSAGSNRKLIESHEGIGAPSESINKLIINRNSIDNTASGFYYNPINRKSINKILIKFEASEARRILEQLKYTRRVTTSFYIAEPILNRFYETLRKVGIRKKEAGRVVECLMLAFIEKVEKQLEGGEG